jgi:hypothetical protein
LQRQKSKWFEMMNFGGNYSGSMVSACSDRLSFRVSQLQFNSVRHASALYFTINGKINGKISQLQSQTNIFGLIWSDTLTLLWSRLGVATSSEQKKVSKKLVIFVELRTYWGVFVNPSRI